ncbi:MAG TPA: hypothetical protein VIC57_05445 [Candidatus Dormibacteraeota bacterium]
MTDHQDGPLVVAATAIEARAVRRARPGARLVRSGMALSRLDPAGRRPPGPVITCGVAGGLVLGLPTGAVLVPSRVLRPDGEMVACDPALVEALAAAARRLGHEPELGPMATAPELVVGAERAVWAARGCVGVDMETGFLDAARLASVRVVLDTPERELHPAWRRAVTALWRPAALAQLPWLLVETPRCARLAAAVLAEALLSGGGR